MTPITVRVGVPQIKFNVSITHMIRGTLDPHHKDEHPPDLCDNKRPSEKINELGQSRPTSWRLLMDQSVQCIGHVRQCVPQLEETECVENDGGKLKNFAHLCACYK